MRLIPDIEALLEDAREASAAAQATLTGLEAELADARRRQATLDKIAVMQAFADGAVIEVMMASRAEDQVWPEIQDPSWDWVENIYRVKPSVMVSDSDVFLTDA